MATLRAHHRVMRNGAVLLSLLCVPTSCTLVPLGASCNASLGRVGESTGTVYVGINSSSNLNTHASNFCDTGLVCGVAAGSNESTCASCFSGLYCPAGTISDVGSTALTVTTNRCRGGRYCSNSSSQISCAAGYHCPDGQTTPRRCFNLGYYCAMNSVRPAHCPGQYYCPSTSIKVKCPAGAFCLIGSASKIPCVNPSWLYSCAEGSLQRTVNKGACIGMFLSVILLVVISIQAVTVFCNAPRVNVKFDAKTGGDRSHDPLDQWNMNSLRKMRRVLRTLHTQLCHPYISSWVRNMAASRTDGPWFARAEQARVMLNDSCLRSSPGMISGVLTDIEPARGFSIDFSQLSLTFEFGGGVKTVLANASAHIPACTLTALMGSSGAGKTSLLNVLCGRAFYGMVSGRILLNQIPANMADVLHSVGFVPQLDVVHGDLTVAQNLYYSAKLRLPAHNHTLDIETVVEQTLDLLQLKHVRDVVVGTAEARGISGGQLKRVNIGLELVSRPKILFLDEPTSGLDAATAGSVCHSLKALCSTGVTVVAVIHQPRSETFYDFDNLILLNNGQPVFVGETRGVVPYFTSLGYELPVGENPADWILDVVSGLHETTGLEMEDLCEVWSAQQHRVSPDICRASECDDLFVAAPRPRDTKQLLTILAREVCKRSMKHTQYALLTLAFCVFGYMASLAGSDVYGLGGHPQHVKDNVYLAAFSCILNTIAFLGTFSDDRLIFWRESSWGQPRYLFFTAQFLLDAPLLLLYNTVYALVYILTVQPVASISCTWTALLFLGFASSGYSYMFGVCVNNPLLPAITVGGIVLGILFSGFTPGLFMGDHPNLALFYAVSPARWSMEMLAVSTYSKVLPADARVLSKGFGIYEGLIDTQKDYYFPLMPLVVIGVLTRALALVGLYTLNRGQMAKVPLEKLLNEEWRRCSSKCDKWQDTDMSKESPETIQTPQQLSPRRTRVVPELPATIVDSVVESRRNTMPTDFLITTPVNLPRRRATAGCRDIVLAVRETMGQPASKGHGRLSV